MEIKHATETDIPSIVGLLKKSLGESLMPKSEAFWRWKHIDNPFGKSPVLLAFEGDQMIGVRAFMRWEWILDNKIHRAVRAVDTATHPQYQGKGVFNKLTMALVEQCYQDGIEFIFNTPNRQSQPGYLKMGWENINRLMIHIHPVFSWGKKDKDFDVRYGVVPASFDYFDKAKHKRSSFLSTNVSREYLKWRYAGNPNVRYYVLKGNGEYPPYVAVFRVRKSRGMTEFRICDWFTTESCRFSDFASHVKKTAREAGANMITWSGGTGGFPLFSIPLRIGPDVTVRPLRMAENDIITFGTWKPVLGDLEVF